TELDPEVAERILLEGYPHDEDVAAYCVAQFQVSSTSIGPRLPFEHTFNREVWQLLGKNFQDHVALTRVIDEYLQAPGRVGLGDFLLVYAALVGRTPVAKQFALRALQDPWPQHA